MLNISLFESKTSSNGETVPLKKWKEEKRKTFSKNIYERLRPRKLVVSTPELFLFFSLWNLSSDFTVGLAACALWSYQPHIVRMHTFCNIQDSPISQSLFGIQINLVICNFPSLSHSCRWEPLLALWRREIWSGQPVNMRYAQPGYILKSDPSLGINSSSSSLPWCLHAAHCSIFITAHIFSWTQCSCLSSVSLNNLLPPGTVITHFMTCNMASYFLKQHFWRVVAGR